MGKKNNKVHENASLNIPSQAAERFFNSFEKSARRWEMIVYPAMVLVLVIMAYGFYFVHSLTNDMRHMMARFDDPQIVNNLNSIANAMHSLSSDINHMTGKIDAMAGDTSSMSGSTAKMAKLMISIEHMGAMNEELKRINKTIAVMGQDVNYLRQDMHTMNRSISRPMNMMNSVLPF